MWKFQLNLASKYLLGQKTALSIDDSGNRHWYTAHIRYQYHAANDGEILSVEYPGDFRPGGCNHNAKDG